MMKKAKNIKVSNYFGTGAGKIEFPELKSLGMTFIINILCFLIKLCEVA